MKHATFVFGSCIVFLPALDLDVFELEGTERLDESLGKAGIGDQWDIVVDSVTTDVIAIGQLALGLVLRDVDDEIELMLSHEVDDVVFAILVWPAHRSTLYAIVLEELGSTCRSIDVVAVLHEVLCWLKELHLALGTTR